MSDKTEAQEYMEILTYSLNQQKGDIVRVKSLQDSYDNKINPDIWPTQSEIPTAQHFVAVEEALGPALDMCFPESNGLQLIPEDMDVAADQLRNAEWALWTMVQHRMRIRDRALKSLKDCFKCSVGYGKVEPITITPNSSARVVIGSKSTRIMAQGDPVTSIRYRYISAGKIIPYPSGTDFNGPDATPISFHYDPHPAWQIKAMFDGNTVEGINPEELQSTYAEIEAAAEKFNRSGVTDFTDFIEKMGGRSSRQKRDNLPDSAPMDIPIIKIFEQPGTEVWIVPESNKDGVVLLKRESDELNQLSNGLVKWDAWPDADRWFPMSQPEADQKRAFAYDLWLNFFYDMMGRTKDAQRVIDKSALRDEDDRLGFYGDIFTKGGKATEAVSYIQPPKIDPSIPAVGDVLDRLGQKIQGTRDFTAKNFTRGGTMAFNDLLNTMQARQRLTSMILETGALTSIFEHVLSYMQQLVPEDGYELQRPVYDPNEGAQLLERRTITQEDLRHGYSISLDTAERRMLGSMDDQTRFQYWQALKEDPTTRRAEVNKLMPLPDTSLRRIFKDREETERIQEEEREVQLTSQLAGAAGAGGGAQTGAGGLGGVNAAGGEL